MARILVVDDQPNVRMTLKIMLAGAGHEVEMAADGDEACRRVEQERFDLVLSDLKMGDVTGIDLLRHIRAHSNVTEFILMTAYGSVSSAVEAMKLGAHDYLQKPFQEPELLLRIERAVAQQQLQGEFSAMVSEFRDRYHLANLVGRSSAMRHVLGRIVRVAPTDATVLITGESGTGKELVARALHANSKRHERPFIPVNCAAVSESLLESELFGHVRGAYTGAVSDRRGLIEDANHGTFFFDEIAETTPAFQSKLLRVIQEGEFRRVGGNKSMTVDIRIIAATNQDLNLAIKERRFREDLFYRLNVVRLIMPPLRDRPEDVPLLITHFAKRVGKKLGKTLSFSQRALEYLRSHDYPGNVRELENLIEQGGALSLSGEVQLDDIMPPEARSWTPRSAAPATTLQEIVDQAESAAIRDTLNRVQGSKEEAAASLGLSATTLWRKMKRHDIS